MDSLFVRPVSNRPENPFDPDNSENRARKYPVQFSTNQKLVADYRLKPVS
jgi:hypothetical protein